VTRAATLFIYSLSIAILVISGFSIPLSAQSGSIRLEGSVWDPSGESLGGAILTAVEEYSGRQWSAVSEEDGRYIFLALQPGTYTVTAKAKGFKDVILRSIALFVPGTTSEDFSFEVSSIDKEVPQAELTRRNDSQYSRSLSRKQIEALPDLNRNPLSLLVYEPGVQINSDRPGYSTINGTRPAMNGVGMDGISITDPVQPHLDSSAFAINPDSISGIQIVTIGAKAEYGRSGGAQVTLTSRPGTQSWHGGIYDYFRNKNLDANEFFNNASNVTKPALTRNIFGVSLSGPAFGKKNLLFVNAEGIRTDQQLTQTQVVLTPEAKTGLFRWYTPGDTSGDTSKLNSFDIVAKDPRHLGIDPAIAPILALLPSPNYTGIGDGINTSGYRFNSPSYLNKQGTNFRLDRSASLNHQLFARFNWSRIDATDISNNQEPTYPGQKPGTLLENHYSFAAGSDWALSPRTVNELRGSYMQSTTDAKRAARLTTPMLIANSWSNPLNPSFPRSFGAKIFEISDYFSHSRSAHTFKFGFNFRRTVQNSTDYGGVWPNVTLGTTMGNNPSVGPSGVAGISSIDRQRFEALYNDLLGRIESVSQTFNSSLTSVSPAGTPRKRDYLFNEFAGFVQDDWRITDNLTLNLGFRYEVNMSPKEQNGYQATLDQVSKIGPSANISNFKFASSNRWYSSDLKNFAPRAGFAWDPFGSGTLVLRGSYGIYYDRLIGAVTNFADQNSYGYSQNIAIYPNAAGTDVRLRDGIPVPTTPSTLAAQPSITRSSSIAVLDSNLRTPRVDQFSFMLEKRLWGAIWEAGYVGTHGKRLFQYVNLNQTKTGGDFLQAFQQLQSYRNNGVPVPATNTLVRLFGSPIAALNALGGSVIDTGQAGVAADTLDRDYYSKYAGAQVSDFYIRNFPQFNAFFYGSSSAESWYNALQLGLRKSSKNYNLRAFYTWSKSLDTISSDGDSYVAPADSMNPKANKAPSDFDRRKVFKVSFDYALPFGRNPSSDSEIPKWLQAGFGGWNLGLIYIKETGAPFSVYSGLQSQFAGINSLANFSGSRNIGDLFEQNGVHFWFSADQKKLFSNPVAGVTPTSGRNEFTGPGYSNLDLLLQKKFMARENKSLQFRIEAYNPLNKRYFGNPVSDFNSIYFGIISSTQGTPRRMQLSLHYQF
jgi:hypothetical protein